MNIKGLYYDNFITIWSQSTTGKQALKRYFWVLSKIRRKSYLWKSILMYIHKNFNGILCTRLTYGHSYTHTHKQTQNIHSSRISKFFFNSILFIHKFFFFFFIFSSFFISQSRMNRGRYNYGLLTPTSKVSSQCQFMDNPYSVLITHWRCSNGTTCAAHGMAKRVNGNFGWKRNVSVVASIIG